MADYQSTHTGEEIDNVVDNALLTPTAVLASNELVGVGVNGEQVRVQLGEGLTLSGTTSPYMLSASGGGGGTQLYKHIITGNNRTYLGLILTVAEPLTGLYDINDLLLNQQIVQVYYLGDTSENHDVWSTALINYDSDGSPKKLVYYDNHANTWVYFNMSDYGIDSDTVTSI